MKAKYIPKLTVNISTKLIAVSGMLCKWDFAYEIKGIKYYTTDDINFPTTDSISEFDLKIINGD